MRHLICLCVICMPITRLKTGEEKQACAAAPVVVDPVESAKEAGLVYVSDASPGITRRAKVKQFEYIDPAGKKVTDQETLLRIRSLVIPPAWKDVWICTSPRGHIQAVGRDQRGRKQYKYHE